MSQLALIADLARRNPDFAAEAARVWGEVTGGRGAFVVDGKVVEPGSMEGVPKALP